MAVSALAGLRARILATAERRLPALTRLRHPEPLPVRLERRRIYVLPTGFGGSFAVLLFVMLIGALNYGNNPALLLTCLLAAAAWASLFFGFRVISGVVLTRVEASPTHAGEPLRLRLHFDPGARARPSLRVRCGATRAAIALRAGESGHALLELPGAARGWWRPGRFRVWTDYPLGLFALWSWLHPETRLLIYAAPEVPTPALPDAGGELGERVASGASEELSGLRDYRTTDAARLIAWKPSVRHDTLLVRDAERRAGSALTLDYFALNGLGAEARIARLTAWVLSAEAEGRPYRLRIPGESIGAGIGAAQREAVLRALALLPGATGTSDDE